MTCVYETYAYMLVVFFSASLLEAPGTAGYLSTLLVPYSSVMQLNVYFDKRSGLNSDTRFRLNKQLHIISNNKKGKTSHGQQYAPPPSH